MRMTTCMFGFRAARFERDLQIHGVVLACHDDGARFLDVGGFERCRAGGVVVDDRHAPVARLIDRIGIGIEFDDRQVLAHLVQFQGDAVAEMTQPDQDDVTFQSGCDSHFPFLVAGFAVEEQASKIRQTLGERNHPDQRNEEVEQLQRDVMRKIAVGGLQKSGD
ncbi:MAG: hypothetical protein HND47_14920 [Chloroflexi bacterium]|nr:hypothetical protein [Chloroflexota bacterium]